jgi:digeranylgeranylglycerophospholipid reductase
LVKEGAILVGDAARKLTALAVLGLAYSLFAGKLAGKTAAEAFNGNTVNYKHLRLYEKTWNKKYGKQQQRSYSLKKFVEKYADDQFLDRIAQSLSKDDPAKLNYLKVFTRTFSGHPILLLKAIKLFR